jgi:LysM repeat protein
MLYVVKTGDTLSGISRRVGSTVNSIMAANVICNPSLIFPGQLLLIPENGMELPKAGPRGDIQIYDFVQVIGTGESGFIPRVGFNEMLIV